MEATGLADLTCGAFEGAKETADLEPDVIHRFLVGQDSGPVALSTEEASAELGDPVATLLLLNGVFPKSTRELLERIDEAAPEDHPLRKNQMSFVLGEGSQIRFTPETADLDRSFRFLVTRGEGDVDLFISTFDPAADSAKVFIEVMAWDAKTGGFNYYRTVGGAWVFAGNSRHALEPPTERAGPFETHRSGNLIMKELRLPWVHWHSPTANIFDSAMSPDDPRRTDPLFHEKTDGGAYVLEGVVMRSIQRWTEVRFQRLLSADGTFARPKRVIEQVLETPTVNLASSQRASGALRPGDQVDLPPTFFVNERALTHPQLGLPAPPPVAVDGEIYLASLQEFGFHLEGFDPPGGRPMDTHFAFVIPEPAFEDFDALRKALEVGLITPRLAAALLMVDFPNPVFSSRRAHLLNHAPETAHVENNASGFSQEMADRILAVAPDTANGSAEREFTDRWTAGDDFRAQFSGLLTAYYEARKAQLASQDGFNNYVRLAESRRRLVQTRTRLVEFKLLFPKTSIPDTAPQLAMQPDATVVEIPGAEA